MSTSPTWYVRTTLRTSMTLAATLKPQPRPLRLPRRTVAGALFGNDHLIAGTQVALHDLRVGVVVETDGHSDANGFAVAEYPHGPAAAVGAIADGRQVVGARCRCNAARRVPQCLVGHAHDVVALVGDQAN